MKTAIARTLATTIIAAALGTGALIAPAQAGGQISIGINAANSQQAQALNLGLGIYALANQIQQSTITQKGNNNSAGLAQNGPNNFGIVHQQGNGHSGTVTQNNGGNNYGLFQFGNGTNAHVNQNGGQSGLGLVFGWR